MKTDSSTVAYLPVPASLLPEAMILIAKLIEPDVADTDVVAGVLGEHPDYGTAHEQLGPNGEGWTSESLARLAEGSTSTTRLISQLLDQLAIAPDTYVPTSVLIERLDVAQPKLRGALGAFTRHLKTHYAGLGWPMDAAWGNDLGEGYQLETYYRLRHDVADNWNTLRATPQR